MYMYIYYYLYLVPLVSGLRVHNLKLFPQLHSFAPRKLGLGDLLGRGNVGHLHGDRLRNSVRPGSPEPKEVA